MRIARLKTSSGPVYAQEYPLGEYTALERSFAEGFRSTGLPVDGDLLAPVDPPTIYCIGLNYRAHAEETGKSVNEFPVVFMKSPTALIAPEKAIELPDPAVTKTVDYEAELAVVIGRNCKNVKKADALTVIAGYTCANDVSARNWQTSRGGGQYCRAKTFDTFCPLGPIMVTPDELPDHQNLRVISRLNGEVMQDSNTSDMIFDVATLIEFLSKDTTLAAGTVILTGTPQGVGVARKPPVYLKDGDHIEIEIEGIGVLRNPVESQ